MSKPRKRRNQAPAGSLPVGKFIPVEAIRCNADGTINVVIRDQNIPTTANRKRNARKKRTTRRKSALKRAALGLRPVKRKNAGRRTTAKKSTRRKR